MLHSLKKRLYFVVAAYFGFWAKFVLRRWKPRIIIITGSSGKTSVLHLIEAQLDEQAVYSHHANSAFGISFQVLGMEPNVDTKIDWLVRIVTAPFHILRHPPSQRLYIVEADCDRPREGAFTSKLFSPEVVLWVSVSRTHSMNFDQLVKRGDFATHEAAIAHEFGYFIEAASKLVLVNADQPDIVAELKRVAKFAKTERFSLQAVTSYEVDAKQTVFIIGTQKLIVPGLHPKELGIGLQMVNELLKYLDLPLDPAYSKLQLPPGRSNILQGTKGIIIIDSTYNTGLGAAIALLKLFAVYPSQHKWLVVGDILEQGSLESNEHERLAEEINKVHAERVVLLGKRTHEHTYPLLQKSLRADTVASFERAGEVLHYLTHELHGGETILFKGAQGLEGVIEQLLADPRDANQLVRRSAVWARRRQAWGLPK